VLSRDVYATWNRRPSHGDHLVGGAIAAVVAPVGRSTTASTSTPTPDESEAGSNVAVPFSSAAPDAAVLFLAPTDGEPAAGGVSPVTVASGVTLEPAGQVADDAGHPRRDPERRPSGSKHRTAPARFHEAYREA
jgi:hypothetical protein